MKQKPTPDDDFNGYRWSVIKRIRLNREKYCNNIVLNPYTTKGEILMKIVFDRYEWTKTKPNKAGKQYDQARVIGKAIGGKSDGQEWSTTFFKNNKEAVSVIQSLNQGDTVEIKMKQNGEFWNAVSIEKIAGTQGEPTVTSPVGAVVMGPSPNNKREGALKLAVESMGPKPPKKNTAVYAMEIGELADLFIDYINESGPFAMNATTNGIPDSDDDGDGETQDIPDQD